MTPATTEAKRYGAYHRVSQLNGRDPDADNYISEDDAWEQIDGWAQMRGVEIAEHYLDRDVSGKTMNRPDLDRMLEDLRNGVIDGIVVAKVDRLSRADVGDALRVVAEIHDIAPGRLAILDLGLDPATDTGEMVLGVLLVLARWQWKRYKRQFSDAQRRAIERGVWIGPTPLGFRVTVAGHDKNDNPISGPLEPSDEAPIVTEAFKIAGVDGLHAAMAYLEDKVPDKRWRTSDVRRLLTSRVYLGEARLGEFVKHNAHTPLTTPTVFMLAQTKPRHRRTNGAYPLTHIARCERCGSGLVGALQTVRAYTYRRYRCSNPTCRGGSSISADKLEDYTLRALEKALAKDEVRVNPGGGDEAREDLTHAETELDLYLATTSISEVGVTRFQAAKQARLEAVEAARKVWASRAQVSAQRTVLPGADELSEPGQFERALRSVVDRIDVVPGRGAIGDRVTIVSTVHDGKGRPRVLVP